ncbi:MAG TPA: cytochrome c [Anaeromyxobacteraceae bacterium]|nr:cytochrome c [Anaeromyxobacteraceae bacterium]
MRKLSMKAAFSVAALALVLQGRAADAPKKTPELVDKGKALFAKSCASCHGAKGEGDGLAAKALNPKPRNLVTNPVKGGAPAIFEVLTSGKKGTAMISYKHLSEDDRWALSYYVDSLKAAKK